jgi:hypothetical protein
MSGAGRHQQAHGWISRNVRLTMIAISYVLPRLLVQPRESTIDRISRSRTELRRARSKPVIDPIKCLAEGNEPDLTGCCSAQA